MFSLYVNYGHVAGLGYGYGYGGDDDGKKK